MTWTPDLPTVPGWYWCAGPTAPAWAWVVVWVPRVQGSLHVWGVGKTQHPVAWFAGRGYRWAGPIPEPTEAPL